LTLKVFEKNEKLPWGRELSQIIIGLSDGKKVN
jgi:hypothetical protein